MLQSLPQRPRWQRTAEWTAAVGLAALWLVAGLWKLSDITATQVRLTQALVPHSLSLASALFLGAAETFAGVLLLAPSWRRWGAWLSGFLLSVFLVYIGYNYRALTGADCSCFPWLKEAVGPMFFVRDGALMLLAAAAGWWAAPSRGPRRAALALAGVAALAAGLWAVDRTRDHGAAAVPVSITADGSEFSLRQGRVFLYFFNPSCLHCFQAAQALARFEWQAAIVGLPTQDFNQGRDFFRDAGMTNVRLSPDTARLREFFPFQDVPYAVAIENGTVRAKIVFFEETQLGETLRRAGFTR